MVSISKLEAAKVQLDRAIQLFFENDHVCAVSLAGAAEDILGSLLQHRGQQSPFEFLHDWYQTEYSANVTKRDFSREIANLPRNWLKHTNEHAASELDVSIVDSIMMLMRAVPCYYKLTGSHSKEMDRFNNHVDSNIEQINEIMS
ncbi:MAG: hypothetical protein HOM55_06670 [Proteobacteria bacterium]|jgi:hypothetical protein|nr:hypothetical protein [Pseudomonadota bacterium]